MPQWEKCDFLILRIIFATSIGEVFIALKSFTSCFLGKSGIGSSELCTVDLAAKCLLKILYRFKQEHFRIHITKSSYMGAYG